MPLNMLDQSTYEYEEKGVAFLAVGIYVAFRLAFDGYFWFHFHALIFIIYLAQHAHIALPLFFGSFTSYSIEIDRYPFCLLKMTIQTNNAFIPHEGFYNAR